MTRTVRSRIRPGRLQETVQLGDPDPDWLLAAHPDESTPLVLPYYTGERSTGWAAAARAVFAGVSASTTGPQLYRAGMEGVALSYQRILDQLRTTAADPQRIVASGRVTQTVPSWLQVLADVVDAPVVPVTLKRATLHGTALHTLVPGLDEALSELLAETPASSGDSSADTGTYAGG